MIMSLALILMFVSIMFLYSKIDDHTQAIKLLHENQLMILKRERKNVIKELKSMKEKGKVRNAAPTQE